MTDGSGPALPGHPAVPGHRDRAARWRIPGLAGLAAALLALSATGIAGAFGSAQQARPAHGVATTHGAVSAAPAAAPAAATAAAARQEAAAWIAGQISHSAVVACDPAMCSELRTRGVPPEDLLVLGPAAAGPVAPDVLVATAAVRREFGSRRLDSCAPAVLAAFGLGRTRVEVRLVARHGAAAYRTALAADLGARRQAGAQLLSNPAVSASPAARQALANGAVDARLLLTLAALAGLHPLGIVSFGVPAPGASAGMPLRSAEIACPAQARTLEFLRAQRPPYLAAVVRAIRLPGGRAGVSIGFAGPSPLGLLTAGSLPPR